MIFGANKYGVIELTRVQLATLHIYSVARLNARLDVAINPTVKRLVQKAMALINRSSLYTILYFTVISKRS